MDSFIEHMIKQRKSASHIIKSILIITAAVLLSFILTFILLLFPIFLSALPILIAAVVYGAYRIISASDVEYEYILTNGELDVDKIMRKKKRKRVVTVHCKAFTHFGKVSDPQYRKLKNEEYARTIDASARSDSFEDYYAVFFLNGQRIMMIFNPTQKMIELFGIYAPRVVRRENDEYTRGF